ncbi:MAG: hypothetical protein QOH89_2438 [Pseudonocardiales bacterium]|jgi:hypothetical protein|nr:hypothetical protein [Pseudonocardiales bacterium]
MTNAGTEGGRGVPSTRGTVYLHCCPAAIAPHVEWALAGVLGRPVRLQWTGQPAAPTHLRSDATWVGPIGTAAKLAASLRAWPMLVFEVTEDGTSASDGERLAYVPGRGFHRSATAANGDVVVGEERLRGLLARANSTDEFRHGIAELLGSAWDAELEPYRRGGDGSPVTLLHQVV